MQAIVRESLREAHARRAALPEEPPPESGSAAGEHGEDEVVERMSYLDMEKREMRDLDGGEDNGRVADVCGPSSPPFSLLKHVT